jgi:2-amino-4-hydroxy-6-hydroxymethyldihydropteridine diphosphokinase
MPLAYIAAGSNLDNRTLHLRAATDAMRRAGIVPMRTSSIYETEPVGYVDQPWFLNMVVEAETSATPDDLLAACLAIERSAGRVRSFRNAPRTLDLDILLFDGLVVEKPGLTIPHPRMSGRRFVLEPLAELAPNLEHPVLKQTIRSLLASCPDTSQVRFYSPGERR